MKEWKIETELNDELFDEDIIEDLCVKSKLPFNGQKVEFVLREVKKKI